MSPHEKYEGIVVGGARDGEMVACDDRALRIPQRRHQPIEFTGGLGLPMPGDTQKVIAVYDFEPRRGDRSMGRWILRETT